jgi:hypothetical protein
MWRILWEVNFEAFYFEKGIFCPFVMKPVLQSYSNKEPHHFGGAGAATQCFGSCNIIHRLRLRFLHYRLYKRKNKKIHSLYLINYKKKSVLKIVKLLSLKKCLSCSILVKRPGAALSFFPTLEPAPWKLYGNFNWIRQSFWDIGIIRCQSEKHLRF